MRGGEKEEGIRSAPNCTLVSLNDRIQSLFRPDSPLGLIRSQVTMSFRYMEFLLPRLRQKTQKEGSKPIFLWEVYLLFWQFDCTWLITSPDPDSVDESPGAMRKTRLSLVYSAVFYLFILGK